MSLLVLLAGLSLVAWLYLLLGRHGFWRTGPFLPTDRREPATGWPAVAAVVPARDEAAHVATALASLRAQDYPGGLHIVLVDDHSEDDTRAVAERAAGSARGHPLEVVPAPALPRGWSGKLWAVASGIEHAGRRSPDARYLLLTDADIEHHRATLRRLVLKAETEGLALTSLMVKLRCERFWERLLIPPFVFFFRKLYPFPAVNDPRRDLAAAAGGCMLVRSEALAGAGGIAAIRDQLIDDLALARLIKGAGGRIWLGLSTGSRSLRAYDRFSEIWAMVTRTADTQLGHSRLMLLATVTGMALVYLVPPLVVLLAPLHGDPLAPLLGLLAWFAMAFAFAPMAKLYAQSPLRGLGLPVAAALFVAMTVASALQHRRGRGGRWKGRTSPQSGTKL